MAKPDPALLDSRRYPFSCAIETRFGDLDFYMHINNVAMAGLIEEARARFNRHAGHGEALGGLATRIASVAIEYLGEGRYPDPLTAHAAIEGVGRSSHQLLQLIVQGETPIAFARVTMVAVDENGPAPLPAAFADRVAPWTLRA